MSKRGGEASRAADAIAEAMAAFEAQERVKAEKAGLTIDAYRAQVTALEEQRTREEHERQAQATRRRRLAPMLPGMPGKVANALIADELDDTRALRVTKRWVRNPEAPPILVLEGGYGSGKTIAAAWAVAAHGSAVYVRAVDFAIRAEPYSGDLARGIKPLHIRRPALLVIDDLGTERRKANGDPDPRFAPAIYDVFDQRCGPLENGRPRRTLITTNLDKEAFIARYAADERNVSRLRRDAFFAPCGNTDLRRAR